MVSPCIISGYVGSVRHNVAECSNFFNVFSCWNIDIVVSIPVYPCVNAAVMHNDQALLPQLKRPRRPEFCFNLPFRPLQPRLDISSVKHKEMWNIPPNTIHRALDS